MPDIDKSLEPELQWKQVDPKNARLETHPGTPMFYANMCGVLFTPDESIFNFALRDLQDPNLGTSTVIVYTTPSHAKRIAFALLQQIAQYEATFGEIPLDFSAKLTPHGRELVEEQAKKMAENKDAK